MAVDLRTTQEYLNAKLGTVGLTKQQCLQRLAGINNPTMTAQDAALNYAGLSTRTNIAMALNNKVGIPTIQAVDQSQVATTTSVGFGKSGSQQKVAQSFIPAYGHLKSIQVRKKTSGGTNIGDVTITLQGDANGSPNGDVIATTTITNATWEALASLAVVTLTADKQLSVSARYWIVFDCSTQDAVNFPNFDASTGDNYPQGSMKSYNGATWADLSAGTDAYFITNVQIEDKYTAQEAARRL